MGPILSPPKGFEKSMPKILLPFTARDCTKTYVTSNNPRLSHNQNPLHKWSTQNYASGIMKAAAAAAISGWDRPLLAESSTRDKTFAGRN